MSMIARIQIVGDEYSAASGLDTLYHNNKKFRDEHLMAADQTQLDIDGNGLNGSRYSALGKRVNGQVVQARLERQVASAKMLAGEEAMFDLRGADVFIFVLTTNFPAAEMLAAMKQNGVNHVADAKKEHTANISRLMKLARETNPQAKFYLVCDISAKYEQGIDADKRPISRVAASMKASAHDAEFYECNRDAYVSPYAEQGQTQRDLYEAVFDGVLQRYLQLHPVANRHQRTENKEDLGEIGEQIVEQQRQVEVLLDKRSKLIAEVYDLEGRISKDNIAEAARLKYQEMIVAAKAGISEIERHVTEFQMERPVVEKEAAKIVHEIKETERQIDTAHQKHLDRRLGITGGASSSQSEPQRRESGSPERKKPKQEPKAKKEKSPGILSKLFGRKTPKATRQGHTPAVTVGGPGGNGYQ